MPRVAASKGAAASQAPLGGDVHTLGSFIITNLNYFRMNVEKNEMQVMNLPVTDGLTVTILPSSDHEFLIPTNQVAKGYGVSEYNIRVHKLRHAVELTEGKHFLTAVSIANGELQSALKQSKIPHNTVLWTKRGVVRLGFFIKSKQAIMFRDWAEDLMIEKLNSLPAIKPVEVSPVDKLMELALEANEIKVRKELYHNYLELRDYTENLKKEAAAYKINHDKWSGFIEKKTKRYKEQGGLAKC